MALPSGITIESGARSREARLVREAQGGSTEAFEQLLKLAERRVFGTAWKMLGDMEEARDACQEVFLRLFRSLGRIDPERALGAWLHRVTVNVCRDLGRRRARLGERGLEPARWEAVPDPTAEVDPEGRARERETRRRLAAALRELPERECRALLLRDVQGLTTREVAELLGSSETTVRSQICRARLKLRRWRERRREESR